MPFVRSEMPALILELVYNKMARALKLSYNAESFALFPFQSRRDPFNGELPIIGIREHEDKQTKGAIGEPRLSRRLVGYSEKVFLMLAAVNHKTHLNR